MTKIHASREEMLQLWYEEQLSYADAAYDRYLAEVPPERRDPDELESYESEIRELRVLLHAQ